MHELDLNKIKKHFNYFNKCNN